MATLHVRNVPDELYEGLRANAAVEGRSIGAQVVVLLQRALTDRAGVRERVRNQLREGLGQVRFLKDARRAVVAAQDEARELGHAEVTSGHLLLGLLRDGGELAELVARPPLALDVGAVRERVRALGISGEPSGRLAFAADAKQALESALRESLALKHRYIGPVHVLLGISAVDGVGARILRELGADHEAVRAGVLFSPGPGPFSTPHALELESDWEYRVLALTGSADEWTDAFNEHAAKGWELVSIVPQPEPRAVFRRSALESD